MRTNLNKYNRINIITLGCAKNIYDSEVLMTQLKANSVQVVHEDEIKDGDIVIVNTCGFINAAKQESINNILELVELKKVGKVSELFVIGCLSERYKTQLIKEIPEVDVFYGLDYLPGILKKFNLKHKKDLIGERILSTPKHYAYLKISDGCNHKCSFCSIPLIKGKYISKPIEEVCFEVEKLSEKGVKELIIIAQDTTFYGLDIYGQRKLVVLLDKLSNINGIDWIRLQYAYPVNYLFDVLDVIKRKANICNYLDIPFQHISDNMLKLMKRGITKSKTLDIIENIRKEVPEIAIRTTLIVGHPKETAKDFEELVNFVKDVRFDRLGVFAYSHEEGTHSYNYKDDVPSKVKEERVEIIMNLQKEISLSLNSAKINKEYKVIVDRKESDHYVGRTEFDTPEVDNEVLIYSGEKEISTGKFYQVRIKDATEYDLIAELICHE